MNVENINRLEWQEYFEQLITLTTDVPNRLGLPQDSELLADRLQVAIESLHQVYSCVDIANNDIENIILQFQVLIQVLNRECHTHNENQSRLAVYQISTNKETCERGLVGQNILFLRSCCYHFVRLDTPGRKLLQCFSYLGGL